MPAAARPTRPRPTRTRPTRTRTVVRTVLVALAVLVVVAAVRYGLLFLGATEGDVPPAAVVTLPAGSRVVDQSKECASGGCWTAVTVEPPTGTSPQELATQLGTPQQVAGTLWDPRTITIDAEPRDGFLVVRADYWSGPAQP